MILENSKEIMIGEVSYIVTDLLHSDKSGYREEYSATSHANGMSSEPVRLIVYKQTASTRNICPNIIGSREVKLRKKLKGCAFDAFHTSLETCDDGGQSLLVIVTSMNEAMSLREAIANDVIDNSDLWRVFKDVVIGLNEISHVTNGGCHFGISPDNIYVYRNADTGLHTIIRGLNLVCDDFDENSNLDKSLVLPAYRAPEGNVRQFIPKSMQWSLALLLVFMLQKQHPWDLTEASSAYESYSRIRRNKPNICCGDELGNVLKKALSFNPAHRFAEIDDFVKEVMKYSKTSMPTSYECFGKPTPVSSSSPVLPTNSGNSERETSGSEDTLIPSSSSAKEPQVSVAMKIEKGEGFAAVAGMSELKDELRRDFIDFITHRNLADQYDIIPPGMLFYGPPGCGKTYLAEHLAHELGIEYSFVNPSDLGSIYIHGSQKMIAELFSNAEKKAQKNGKGVLLIFDEVESMVPSRLADTNENQAGEVAEFLTRLNNSSRRGVYVIGLTNCLDKIDRAILRKGRLDKVVYIDLPAFEARQALFEYELSKRPHTKDIDIEYLSKLTEGFTSSDITYIVTESARMMFASTLRKNSQSALCITQSVLEDVIAVTRPSVTKADMRHYEDMRDLYVSGVKRSRPSVGFAVG